MLSVLPLFCLFYESQGQEVKLQGKLDIDTDMASVLHDLISQYLTDDSKNLKTVINIKKLVDSFQSFTNNKLSKEISNVGGTGDEDKNIKTVNINQNVGDDKPSKEHKKSKKSNVDSVDVRAAKHIRFPSLHISKAKRHRQSTQGIAYDREHEEIIEKKSKITKGVVKEDDKKIETKVNVEKHDVLQQKEENKEPDKKVMREKTILEEIIGMERSVHVYGKHKGDKHSAPLNNIKV